MPRLPFTARRSFMLVHVPHQQRITNMDNLPPLPSHSPNQPLFFTSLPQSQNYQPNSWLEAGLLGHARTLNIQINWHEMVIIIQNTQYLAQLISKGMHIVINNYTNQVWINKYFLYSNTQYESLFNSCHARTVELTTNSKPVYKSTNEPPILPIEGEY